MSSALNIAWVAALAACGGHKSQPNEAAGATPSPETASGTAPSQETAAGAAPLTLNPMRPQLGGGPALGGGGLARAVTPSTISVKVGEVFEVVLEANASTGFTWRVVDPLDVRLAFVDQAYTGPSPVGPGGAPLVGAPGQATLRFKAVTAGEVKLNLRYARPWEQPGAPGVEGAERSFTVFAQ